MRRVISILLAVCLVLSLLAGCSNNHQKEQEVGPVYEEEYKLHDGKKAIIILPGLLASGLYDQETEEALWDPVKSDEVDLLEFMGVYDESHVNITVDSLAAEWPDLLDYASDVLGDKKNSIMRRIMCNEQGDPANPNVVGVPVGYEGHLRYGALNSYKWWAEGLQAEFGEEYEVVVYNYNWLTDTRYAARDFAEFMRRNNYTDTVLIGHSMGGIVATEYMAMGAESRARIDKFIAVAVPFYGSYMASSTFEHPYVFMDLIDYYLDYYLDGDMLSRYEFLQDLDLASTKDVIKETVSAMYQKRILPFLYNMKSVYQLLPSAELLALQAELDNQGAFENGQRIAPADLFDWYMSRPFTTDNPTGTKAETASLERRAIMADWQAYRDGFYVDRPEGKVFACDLVDTYYIVGVDSSTELSINVEGEKRTAFSASAGDGTVPLLSATRGKPEDNVHVFYVSHEQHIPMGTHWDGGQREATLSIIRVSKGA